VFFVLKRLKTYLLLAKVLRRTEYLIGSKERYEHRDLSPRIVEYLDEMKLSAADHFLQHGKVVPPDKAPWYYILPAKRHSNWINL
jgi:hypothetical protein